MKKLDKQITDLQTFFNKCSIPDVGFLHGSYSTANIDIVIERHLSIIKTNKSWTNISQKSMDYLEGLKNALLRYPENKHLSNY